MNIHIKGFIETSFLDWPGRMCAVLFLPGCNLRCPFCHNKDLVLNPHGLVTWDQDQVFSRLKALHGWIEAVCISGGEPCLDSVVILELAKRLKDMGFSIKLDTNGTFPDVLESLISQGLLDFVAMDVKSILCPVTYSFCAGRILDLSPIKKSISIIKSSGITHQFRMTVLPSLHPPGLIRAWAEELAGAGSILTIQNFRPDVTLDPSFSKEQGYPDQEFENLVAMVSQLEKGGQVL